MITIRRANEQDAPEMAALLNEIIKAGGTTAHEVAYTAARICSDYVDAETGISCVVAELNGQVVGFQSLESPYDGGAEFPDNWGIIATFVRRGLAQSGVGSALFLETKKAAKNTGVVAIDATIRADNFGGLGFYGKLGFVDYRMTPGVPLADGTPVDRISKRFDIRRPHSTNCATYAV